MPVAAEPANPVAYPWGRDPGSGDEVNRAWQNATGRNKALLGKIALRPRVRWFGQWIPTNQIAGKISGYIRASQQGDPDKLVQLATFRLWPEKERAKNKPLTAAQLTAYRQWVDAAAAGIGSSRVAVVLEPDLAVALKGWRPSVRLSLARYAAKKLGALPNAAVYLDASDADWLRLDVAVSMLRSAGVQYIRGFALGATHYAAWWSNAAYGRQIIARLNALGIRGKHMVLDTADNGRPFTWLQHYARYPHQRFDNAPACKTKAQVRCVTLGVPPTTNVADPAHVDAYLWFGRPWLDRQASPSR